MSYIRAKKMDAEVNADANLGDIQAQEYGVPDLDMNLDDEVFQFVLGLVEQVENLAEGEALVVWKEIF